MLDWQIKLMNWRKAAPRRCWQVYTCTTGAGPYIGLWYCELFWGNDRSFVRSGDTIEEAVELALLEHQRLLEKPHAAKV